MKPMFTITDSDFSHERAVSQLQAVARRGREWLLEAAARQWRGEYKSEGFLFPERLSIHAEPDACLHRLFVQARHIFSYCEIGRLGWTGPWREMAEASADFLLRRGRRADGFFIHCFDDHGAVFDARADLYDQAFMLLAFAQIGQVTGRAKFFDAAEALDNALDANWRLPHGGYFEGEIAQCPPFRQNPHMHLLEAFIALEAATGAPRWKNNADHLARICEKSFVDPTTGALLEYFDENLVPQPGVEGSIVEPGHCFEWAWLFERLALGGHSSATVISDRFVGFARARGIDRKRGVAINEVLTNGAIRNADARLWPQAERLKAALARLDRTRDSTEVRETIDAFTGLFRYFDTPERGIWRDKLCANGSWVDEPAPGSSLYHITCALAELCDAATNEDTFEEGCDMTGLKESRI